MKLTFFNGAPLADYNDDTWNIVKKISSADFLVFGTPIYQASISGALKKSTGPFAGICLQT